MKEARRRRLFLIGLVMVSGAVAWLIAGIVVFALIAGDFADPHDGPAAWVRALQRVLAGVWLFSPVVATLVVLGVWLRRRGRTAAG